MIKREKHTHTHTIYIVYIKINIIPDMSVWDKELPKMPLISHSFAHLVFAMQPALKSNLFPLWDFLREETF